MYMYAPVYGRPGVVKRIFFDCHLFLFSRPAKTCVCRPKSVGGGAGAEIKCSTLYTETGRPGGLASRSGWRKGASGEDDE